MLHSIRAKIHTSLKCHPVANRLKAWSSDIVRKRMNDDETGFLACWFSNIFFLQQKKTRNIQPLRASCCIFFLISFWYINIKFHVVWACATVASIKQRRKFTDFVLWYWLLWCIELEVNAQHFYTLHRRREERAIWRVLCVLRLKNSCL